MLRLILSNRDPDGKLVTAARNGDPRAFDLLVCRHQTRVSQFVRARLDAGLDADDVVQEVFIAAWRQLPAFRGGSLFKTWLFGIAANLSANASRRQGARLKRIVEWTEVAELAESRNGLGRDPGSESIIDRLVVRQGLAEIAEPRRQALELYYYADLNLREISEVMKVNLSTLKYWFYEAHRELRERMRPSEEHEDASRRTERCGAAVK